MSSANFVPTVTAISTSPDLQWLVQPTLISSVAPSQNRGHPYGVPAPAPPAAYSRPAVLKAPGGRGQSIGRRGKVEQVSGAGGRKGGAGGGGGGVGAGPGRGAGRGSDGRADRPLCPQLSPEEEEKRRIRRERNKMAAAKCRNRRRELTDTLQAVSAAPGSRGLRGGDPRGWGRSGEVGRG